MQRSMSHMIILSRHSGGGGRGMASVPIAEQPELSIIGGRRTRVLDCHILSHEAFVRSNARQMGNV